MVSQVDLDRMASGLDLSLEFLSTEHVLGEGAVGEGTAGAGTAGEGIDGAALGAREGRIFVLRLHLTNGAPDPLAGAGWALRIPSLRRLLTALGDDFQIRHITGDAHELSPCPSFAGWAPGQTVVVDIVGEL